METFIQCGYMIESSKDRLAFSFINNYGSKQNLMILGNPRIHSAYYMEECEGDITPFENIQGIKTLTELQLLFEFERSTVHFLDHMLTMDYRYCKIYGLDPNKRYAIVCFWTGDILALAPNM